MNTLSNYAQFQKSPNTTQTSMNTQPMNQQDMMKFFAQLGAAMDTFKLMQQQAATPATPAAPAPVAAPAPAVVAAKVTTPAKPAAPVVKLKKGNPHYTPEQKAALQKELLELAKKTKSEDKFVQEACKNADFTQQIIAGARGIKDVSSRENGLRLLYRKGGACFRKGAANKKKRKKVQKKKDPEEWENKGDYYACDDDMIKERCQKAVHEGIGARKKAFHLAEMTTVLELVKKVKASTTRADASKAELGAAAANFIKDSNNDKFAARFVQLILDVPNLANREYGYKNLLRLYAPGCPPLQDRGISKKNKKRSAPAAPLVIAAPAQAIAQPAPKKQKVDDAVGSPTTVKDFIPYMRQMLIKALKHCQLPDAQYSAEKWKANYPMLGCKKATFHRHIEVRLNAQGFKWENYGQGKGKWCLDHMTPIRNFLQTDDEDVKMCWHYTNIMPEDYEYNTWKSDKMIWRMCWSLDRWLVQGRNESFRGEEKVMTARGMPCGAWVDFNRVKVQEEQDEQRIVFN